MRRIMFAGVNVQLSDPGQEWREQSTAGSRRTDAAIIASSTEEHVYCEHHLDGVWQVI